MMACCCCLYGWVIVILWFRFRHLLVILVGLACWGSDGRWEKDYHGGSTGKLVMVPCPCPALGKL
jgi:hypothetical protein